MLRIFWTRFKYSSSVNLSQLESQRPNRGVQRMVRKLRRSATTFIQNTFTDSDIYMVKNRAKLNLFWVPVYAETSTCDS